MMKKIFKNLLMSILIAQMVILFNLPQVKAIASKEKIEIAPDSKRVIVEKDKIKPIAVDNNKENSNVDNKPRTKKRLLKSNEQYSDVNSKYNGDKIEGKTTESDVYVNKGGKNYTYTYEKSDLNNIIINRYCFETKEYLQIYNSSSTINIIKKYTYYVKNKVIYVVCVTEDSENKIVVIGYNTETEEVSSNKKFEILKDDFLDSFCVDNNKNIYFALKGENEKQYIIKSYTNGGNFISSMTNTLPENCSAIYLKNANEKILFTEMYIISGGRAWNDLYTIKVNNATFIDNNAHLIREKVGNGLYLKFLNNEQTMAYDQYGEIAQITYNVANESSISMVLRDRIDISSGKYLNTKYLYTSDDKYAYLGGQEGYIAVYNWNTYKIEKMISIGSDKTVIGVYKNNDNLFIEYLQGTSVYAISTSYTKFKEPEKTIEITTHSTLARTKNDIKNKCEELAIVEKNNYDNVYVEKPSTTAPYIAGSLKEQTKIDTLNQINYFRWLAGVNTVTRNDTYMEYPQHGAVLLATSSQLMHKPAKPSDMTAEFYQKAIGGTNAEIGVSMSADISRNIPLAESIQGYIDDTRNIEPDVGHRLSILDPRATSTSFGYAAKQGNVDMFIEWNAFYNDAFYAWPSAGNFPVENIEKEAMWSVAYDGSKYFSSEDAYIILKANGKEYSSKKNEFEMYYDSSYKAYYYKLPEELKTYISDGKDDIQADKKVEVELYGLSDTAGNAYVVKYPVEFFSLGSVDSNTQNEEYILGDINNDKEVNARDAKMALQYYTGKITLTEEQKIAANVNKDNEINARDAKLILQYYTGKITSFNN